MPNLLTCTTRQAARTLGISVGTVQSLVEDGRLRAWKTPGGHRRIFLDSVAALLAAPGNSGLPSKAFEILIAAETPEEGRILGTTLATGIAEAAIRVAHGGYEVLLRLGERRPDVLVVDLALADIDGFQLLAALNHHPNARPGQVLALNGLCSGEVKRRGGLPAGIPIFCKPVSEPALMELIAAFRDTWLITMGVRR